jgi:hypothetical protein
LGVHGGGSGLSLFRPRALTPPPSTPPSLSSRTQWTVINAAGVKSTLLSDKRGIISRFKLGVPIRDMRLMDGGLFAPDAAVILVRDNAIVMRIEHVRLIATASEVLISQDGASGDAAGARFGAALLEAILDAAADGIGADVPLFERLALLASCSGAFIASRQSPGAASGAAMPNVPQ